jgi:hypothetical protein
LFGLGQFRQVFRVAEAGQLSVDLPPAESALDLGPGLRRVTIQLLPPRGEVGA